MADRWRALALGLAVLAGCGAPAVEPPAPLPVPDTCGAAEVADLLGRDATLLERRLILRPVRMIRPGRPATGFGFPQRLNIRVDAAGRVVELRCG